MSIRSAAVVGTGAVGEALAGNLVKHGIDVQIAGRDGDKARQLATKLGGHARAVETKTLGKGVDAVFLAVPAAAALAVLEEASGIQDGLVVDCTNPLTWDAGPVHAPPEEGSVAAQLARRYPRARVVKAFNTFGAEFHADPRLGATVADLYLAGDDADAKREVSELATKLGFEPVDVGPLRNARNLEALAILWVHLATVGGKGREVAFKLLRR
jgi:8-hydroxy-5-deazaflavin:NADPH oxidoreductase